MLFVQFLEDCEGAEATPTDVMIFLTGAATVPSKGMAGWTVKFDEKTVLPKASSCTLTLHLPTQNTEDPTKYAEMLTLGFLSHGFFGQV
eukprot:m.147758 g.147758  ORF g.147758 m.147758 type:complete len:89 (+) comp38475_c0_seq2:201-467(+)